jgi:hypothetical protein
MPDDAVTSNLLSWLNSTGYPLEMRVTRALNTADLPEWEIVPNAYYTTDEPDGFRECDIHMYWGDRESSQISIETNLYIECKGTQSPWVIFKDKYWYADVEPRTPTLFDPWNGDVNVQCSGGASPRTFSAIRNQLSDVFAATCPRYTYAGYAIAESYKKANDRDVAYKAVRQAASATLGLRANGRPEEFPPRITIDIPIVVTSSRIFEAALDDEGKEIKLAEVPRSSVALPAAALPTSEYEGSWSELIVTVINIADLSSLVEDCKPMPSLIGDYLRDLNLDPSDTR